MRPDVAHASSIANMRTLARVECDRFFVCGSVCMLYAKRMNYGIRGMSENVRHSFWDVGCSIAAHDVDGMMR